MERKKQVIEEVIRFISDYQGIPVEEINENDKLLFDLGISSMDLFEMINAMEARFDLKIDESKFEEIETIRDIAKHMQ